MRICRFMRVILRPVVPKHLFYPNTSTSYSSSWIVGLDYADGGHHPQRDEEKTLVHSNYRLLTSSKTLRSLERRLLLVITATGFCFLMSLLCFGIWMNTSWELINSKGCHRKIQGNAMHALAHDYASQHSLVLCKLSMLHVKCS